MSAIDAVALNTVGVQGEARHTDGVRRRCVVEFHFVPTFVFHESLDGGEPTVLEHRSNPRDHCCVHAVSACCAIAEASSHVHGVLSWNELVCLPF